MKMDLHSYKNLRYKTFKLSSGLVIKTKSLSPYTIMKVRRDFESKEENKGKDFWESAFVIDELFQAFLVEPKIPEEMEVNDFLKEDFISVHKTIMSQITISKAKELEEIVNNDKDFRV